MVLQRKVLLLSKDLSTAASANVTVSIPRVLLPRIAHLITTSSLNVLLKIQRLWRIAPKHDDFLLEKRPFIVQFAVPAHVSAGRCVVKASWLREPAGGSGTNCNINAIFFLELYIENAERI